MKVILGFFLGLLAVLILDPKGGQDRRAHVRALVGPMGQRLGDARDRVGARDTMTNAWESAGPAVANTLKSVATAVQGKVVDASSAVSARAGRDVSNDNEGSEANGAQDE